MNLMLDHIVILVPELEATIASYGALGFNGDDDELRAFEARFNVAWEAMSDKERERAIGVLVRMLEEEGLRLH